MNERLAGLAPRLAAIALGHVAREFPHAAEHVMVGPDDMVRPAERHPIFYGSFDWHSCVHSHWLLARLLRLQPDMAEAAAIRAHFDQAFTPEKVDFEAGYFRRPTSRGFERPYGWAWLLKLISELRNFDEAWARTLQPLATIIAERLCGFLPLADYPVRGGAHANTAFALALSLDYARAEPDGKLLNLIEGRARAWYGDDRDCQAWEPSGDDFLSPALVEAELMRRILPEDEFRAWFAGFLPGAAEGRPETLFAPVRVSDRSDGKIAHLDGLNLSRAWCWRTIAAVLEDPVRSMAQASAESHLAAALPHLEADYMGEHWLASFALLAVSEP
jgi:hypothetical protein